MNTPARRRRAATSALSRRQLLASLAAVPAIGVVLAACGDRTRSDAGSTPDATTGAPGTSAPPTTDTTADTTTTGPETAQIEYDPSPDAVIVRVSYEGGFVPVDFDFTRQPAFLLAGDGQAFVPAPTTMEYPGPLVSPYSVRVVDPDGVRAILALAASKGLLGEIPDYDSERSMQIADAPGTVVTLAVAGATYRHAAYALGMVDGMTEETPARQALWEFVQAVSSLDTVVPAGSATAESAYVPATYRIKATPVDPATIEDTAPAAEAPEGTAGWAPHPSSVVEWPAEAGVSLADSETCALVPASAVAELFAAADTETRFRDGDRAWSVIVAAVIPGDAGCAA